MTTIAVVEDDEMVLDMICETLLSRGYEVLAFPELQPAYEVLATQQPDMVITDVELPDGSGLDLVRFLRKLYEDIPVLVQSGCGDETDLLAGFDAGASDYITKPVAIGELLAKCSVLLARSAANAKDPGSSYELPGGLLEAFGRYRIEGLLGEGGGGTVFSAYDLKEERKVALKVLPALLGLHGDRRQRFVREVYSLSTVQHASVARVYDFGASEGRSYFAMEHVSGQNLEERILEQGPANEEQVLALMRGLASALVAVHSAGLIHRDIKPSNVVLRGNDFSDPVLVDFGLAKRPADHTLTRTGAVLGTPAYLSPEQVRGGPMDARSDLYSLGLVAHFALSGGHMHAGSDLRDVLWAAANPTVRMPDTVGPATHGALSRLIRREPSDRYATAAAFIQALQGCPSNPKARRRSSSGETSPGRRPLALGA